MRNVYLHKILLLESFIKIKKGVFKKKTIIINTENLHLMIHLMDY